MLAAYCASYCCGVSAEHLAKDEAVYPVITSIMRFHLYFTIRRVIRRIQGGEHPLSISREFSAGGLHKEIKKVPRDEYWRTEKLTDGTMGEVAHYNLKSSYKSDYGKYIPEVSNGFTQMGKYLNESIKVYIYIQAVLGSQAKTRMSIEF